MFPDGNKPDAHSFTHIVDQSYGMYPNEFQFNLSRFSRCNHKNTKEVGKFLVPMRSSDFSCEQCGVGSAARVTGRDNYERTERSPAHAQAAGCKDPTPIDVLLITDNYFVLNVGLYKHNNYHFLF